MTIIFKVFFVDRKKKYDAKRVKRCASFNFENADDVERLETIKMLSDQGVDFSNWVKAQLDIERVLFLKKSKGEKL